MMYALEICRIAYGQVPDKASAEASALAGKVTDFAVILAGITI
ncbi:hypothetical protein WG219_16230 [Ectopseudomonas mendocina]|uniref:Uncharacterized protein n=1 Tax=Ectopseudomonas mendocina TaxID=300 RepID=A0ABZ2RL50_ECTME